jgi:hypothetical protein
VTSLLGLLVCFIQGTRNWRNERALEKWWAKNNPDALAARIKAGTFFAGIKTSTLRLPGGREVTGELRVLPNEDGHPWVKIEDEFHSLSKARIPHPLNPDDIDLSEGIMLQLHRDEEHQGKLSRVRQLIDDL